MLYGQKKEETLAVLLRWEQGLSHNSPPSGAWRCTWEERSSLGDVTAKNLAWNLPFPGELSIAHVCSEDQDGPSQQPWFLRTVHGGQKVEKPTVAQSQYTQQIGSEDTGI